MPERLRVEPHRRRVLCYRDLLGIVGRRGRGGSTGLWEFLLRHGRRGLAPIHGLAADLLAAAKVSSVGREERLERLPVRRGLVVDVLAVRTFAEPALFAGCPPCLGLGVVFEDEPR